MSVVALAHSPSVEAPIGQLIDDRYRIEGVLGRGAMGSVYEVVDVGSTPARRLALKILHLDPEDLRRASRVELWFRREFHTIARLRHPTIVEVYDFGVDRGQPYYTMELLDGEDLRERVRVDIGSACRWIRDVTSALAFLHARGLLHRDLKGRNVRCTEGGRAKLLDFGVLATMGVTGEVAGTPPCIAPEAVRGLPLDARSDLFGLGTLLYWVLTGRHAFGARVVRELESLWAEPPPPVSALRPDVPPALDELVTSLLSIDREGRPSSAAEVIDRLDAIAGLEPDPELEVARGWLTSAALVGREQEVGRLREALRDMLKGRGSVLVLDAASGAGKTRLLQETGLEGQLAGAAVLEVRARSESQRPYAVLRDLIARLITVSPRDAARTVLPHATMIGRVLPEVARAAEVEPDRRPLDPAEERLRVQSGLLAWLVDVSEERPLLLLVDELQRCDEASAALLAALGHMAWRHPIVIVAAQRSSERVRASAAIGMLRDAGDVLSLSGLTLQSVEQLVGALFGDAPGCERLAAWMHRVAGGNPMHCLALARHLVDDDVVRYAEGMWLIPSELPEGDTPRALSDAFDQRLASLGPSARALGETLSLLSCPASLELCIALMPDRSEAEVFAALDQLVLEDLLLGDDAGFEVRHDAVRESFVRGMDDERRGGVHRLAADVLSKLAGDDPEFESEIGWHDLRGGRELAGAARLERSGMRLYAAQSFADAVPPLEAALDAYERHGSERSKRLALRHALMRAGVVCDRKVVLRYADDTIAAFDEDAGLHRARRWSTWLGPSVALLLGTLVTWAVWWLGGRKRTRPDEAIATLVALVNYAASVHCLAFELDRIGPLIDVLRPLSVRKHRVPHAATLLAENFLCVADGRFDQLHRNCDEILRIVETDRRTPLSPIDRGLAIGAAHYMKVTALTMNQDPEFERPLEQLRVLDLKFFELGAEMGRVFFHRLRGEEAKARELREATEVMFVQLGNAWVFESQLTWISGLGYALTGDVIGMKRTLDQLSRYIESGYRLEGFAHLLRAEYLRVRGDPGAARIALGRALDELPEGERLQRQLMAAALVDALVAEGDHEEALRLGAHALNLGDERGRVMASVAFRIRRAMALARAGLGRHEEGRSELEELRGWPVVASSPVLSGALDEAMAKIWLEMGELERARECARQVEGRFSETANPVLIARARRVLPVEGRGGDSQADVEGVSDELPDAQDETLSLGAEDLGSSRGSGGSATQTDFDVDTALLDGIEP